MIVNWEQELELLRYLEHETYCIKVGRTTKKDSGVKG